MKTQYFAQHHGGLWGGDWGDVPPWKTKGTSPPGKLRGRPPWMEIWRNVPPFEKNWENVKDQLYFFLSNHKWPEFEIILNPGRNKKVPLPENPLSLDISISRNWFYSNWFIMYSTINQLVLNLQLSVQHWLVNSPYNCLENKNRVLWNNIFRYKEKCLQQIIQINILSFYIYRVNVLKKRNLQVCNLDKMLIFADANPFSSTCIPWNLSCLTSPWGFGVLVNSGNSLISGGIESYSWVFCRNENWNKNIIFISFNWSQGTPKNLGPWYKWF